MVDLSKLPRTIEMKRAADDGALLVYIDERFLPGELRIEKTGDWRKVVDAVKTLAVRGAPAIGIAGAGAVTLWACNEGSERARSFGCGEATARFLAELAVVAAEVSEARPTAVNLAWAVDRLVHLAHTVASEGVAPDLIAEEMYREVRRMVREDEAVNRAMGANGAALLGDGSRILTHCNAGSLATAFYGTALGVVYAAAEQGKVERVYADETRPVGQGARLTVWELAKAGVPVTLICDNMAASLMAQGCIDAVIVGADRITANGDAANKIGTYGVAVLAKHHGIPVYVVAPSSTIDMSLATGSEIPIEQRAAAEVLPQAIEGVDVYNPAFDVTPAALITKIVTERGVFSPDELAAAYA